MIYCIKRIGKKFRMPIVILHVFCGDISMEAIERFNYSSFVVLMLQSKKNYNLNCLQP